MANTGSSKDRASSRLKNIFFTCMSKYLKFERIFHSLIAYWIQVEQVYGSHFQMKKLRLVTLKALPKFTRLKSDWAQVACRAVRCDMLPHTRLPSSCLLTRKDSQQCSSSPCDGRIPVHNGSSNMKYSLSHGLSVWELPATTGNTENENSKLKTIAHGSFYEFAKVIYTWGANNMFSAVWGAWAPSGRHCTAFWNQLEFEFGVNSYTFHA